MTQILISRIYQEDCTIGYLNFGIFRCATLELADKDNQQNISCIPAGTYSWVKVLSPSLGDCIDIQGVVGRTYIRIHSGNYTSQIQGCVLVGEYHKDINNDGIPDVVNSKVTLSELMSLLPDSGVIVIK